MDERYAEYLKHQIRDKQEAKARLDGEISGLEEALSSYLAIKRDEAKKVNK